MILDRQTAENKMRRMAMEITERNHGTAALLIVGIRESGWHIARKLAAHLREVFPGTIELSGLTLDKRDPGPVLLEADGSFEGRTVVLVDDVANSGRTMLYALIALMAHRPAGVQTVALLERTYKRFPLAVDYVGLSVSTTPEEYIEVLVEEGEITGACIRSRGDQK